MKELTTLNNDFMDTTTIAKGDLNFMITFVIVLLLKRWSIFKGNFREGEFTFCIIVFLTILSSILLNFNLYFNFDMDKFISHAIKLYVNAFTAVMFYVSFKTDKLDFKFYKNTNFSEKKDIEDYSDLKTKTKHLFFVSLIAIVSILLFLTYTNNFTYILMDIILRMIFVRYSVTLTKYLFVKKKISRKACSLISTACLISPVLINFIPVIIKTIL